MKKSILLILAICFISLQSFAQNSKTNRKLKSETSTKTSKVDEWNAKRSPFEIELTKGGWIPNISANWYITEKTILKLTALDVPFVDLGKTNSAAALEIGAFLEFRKYGTNRIYFSHGPALGYERIKGIEEDKDIFKMGYNAGVGYRISKALTAGTYISPYAAISSDSVDFTHGRLFLGTFQNIYLAYRF